MICKKKNVNKKGPCRLLCVYVYFIAFVKMNDFGSAAEKHIFLSPWYNSRYPNHHQGLHYKVISFSVITETFVDNMFSDSTWL